MSGFVQSKVPLMIGPCVIEDEGLVLEIARELKRQLNGLPVQVFFKASFDKANRSSIEGFRGPGLKKGLEILGRVKSEIGFQVMTDFHTPEQARPVAEVCDLLQVPAFLCRQTDMIEAGVKAVSARGAALAVKKGQFLAPWDAKNIVEKATEAARLNGEVRPISSWFCLTERGTSFGYNTLVVDMSAFRTMKKFGVPVIYDATHSIQSPGGGAGGKSTGGKRENLEVLARAAMAAGADGLFMEVHPNPSKAKSDGPNALYLEHAGAVVKQLLQIREVVQGLPFLLPEARA